MGGAKRVRQFAMESADLPDATRDELLSFLSGGSNQGYVPQSGEIVGILKTVHDEMTKAFNDATDVENDALKNYVELSAAKKQEISILQAQIESEMTRSGNLGVSIAEMENDKEDTEQALSADQKFKVELKQSCATKSGEWEGIKKTRQEELTAIAETIRVLNDDDALELFKKTLPSASMSLVQVAESTTALRVRALAVLAKATGGRPGLDLISLALRGKKVGFEKVIGMINEMVKNLANEQGEDESKKGYCDTQLDQNEDKKNRLNKFYNPTMYKPPPGREMSEEERITVNMGGTLKPIVAGGIAGTGIGASFVQVSSSKDAPPPPPETFGAYTKKTEKGHGVVGMIDLLVADLDKELQAATVNEKEAQQEYETMMQDASEKRAADSKSITQKSAEKASTEEALQDEQDKKGETTKELMNTAKFISSLHGECDWLLKYFGARKEARAGEVEALKNAKAVLSGADYSLLQSKAFLVKRHVQ